MVSNPFCFFSLIPCALFGRIYIFFLQYLLSYLLSVLIFLFFISFFIENRKKIIPYLRSQYRNYILLIFTVIVCLIFAEAVLRLQERILKTSRHEVRHYEVCYSYKQNSAGFRDDEFKKTKDKGVFRVFLIGDSFVEGIVEEEKTLDKLMEKKCSEDNFNCEVYNLGKDGAGPSYYWVIANEFREYAPDLIVVSVYVDNDIERTQYYKTSPENKFLYPVEKLVNKIRTGSELLKMVNDYLEKRKLYSLAVLLPIDDAYLKLMHEGKITPWLIKRAMVGDNQLRYNYIVEQFYKDPAFKTNILAIKRLYKDIPFLLLINPSKIQVNLSYLDSMRKVGYFFKENKLIDRKIQDAIISWANENGIDCLDILPYMLQAPHNENFFYKIEDHYAAKGDEFVADILYSRLKKMGVLKRF